MKNIVVRNMVLSGFALLAVIVAGGNLSAVQAQGSDDRAIGQAQRAVRQRIISQQGGNSVIVVFNTDAEAEPSSRSAVRISGTGSFSRNDPRYSNSRNNDQRNNDSRYSGGRSREFTYQAIVSRSRSGSVSGIRYDLSNSGDGRNNDGRDNNGRDNRDNNGRDRDNRGGFGERPEGRVSYTGPISNRHSDKSLDVTERSNQNGANIQQWGYSDQPNQNWDIIDLGNGESAIISRQSGRALTSQGGRDRNGANIIQETWRGASNQRWRLERVGGEYYKIVSVDNGKSLDVTQSGRQDGASIQLWDYSNQANQQWRLRK